MKRILAAGLAVLLLISLFPSALAADSAADQATVLAALDIMSGDDKGELNPERTITRAEFTKMAVSAHPTGRYSSGTSATSPFYDVPAGHWAAGYIASGVELGLIRGYLDGLFRPSGTITLEEAVSVLLRLLGYQDSDFVGAYPAPQLAACRSLALDAGVSAKPGEPITRRDAQALFYNLLCAKNKAGQVYLTTLGHAVTASGTPDVLALVNSAMEGPVVAQADWEDRLGFTVQHCSLNGSSVSSYDIRSGDVIYYSDTLRSVWAYRNQVTGVYESASPSLSAPASVTVSGRTYALDGEAVTLAMSDVGGAKLGEQVTLLLGRDGKAAARLDRSDSIGSGGSAVVKGVLMSTGTGSYVDKDGHPYERPTLTMTAADGNVYTYPLRDRNDVRRFAAGKAIQVTLKDGLASVEGLEDTALTGRVNSEGTKLGGRSFASDVGILDISDNNDVISLTPDRLAGASLAADDVRYASRNSAGEIDCLILDDYTGDAYQYGFLIEGESKPVQFIRTEMVEVEDELTGLVTTVPEQIYHVLRETPLTELSHFSAKNGSVTYYLADQVLLYEKEGGKYYQTSMARLLDGDYTLTGYYDKGPGQGGRIRVVVAQAKK